MTDGPNLFHFSIWNHHGREATTSFAALSGGIRSTRRGLPALPIKIKAAISTLALVFIWAGGVLFSIILSNRREK